jgi:hypothetical protein
MVPEKSHDGDYLVSGLQGSWMVSQFLRDMLSLLFHYECIRQLIVPPAPFLIPNDR